MQPPLNLLPDPLEGFGIGPLLTFRWEAEPGLRLGPEEGLEPGLGLEAGQQAAASQQAGPGLMLEQQVAARKKPGPPAGWQVAARWQVGLGSSWAVGSMKEAATAKMVLSTWQSSSVVPPPEPPWQPATPGHPSFSQDEQRACP